METFTSHELELANYATSFAVSVANQCEVGQCAVSSNCALTNDRRCNSVNLFRSIQFSLLQL